MSESNTTMKGYELYIAEKHSVAKALVEYFTKERNQVYVHQGGAYLNHKDNIIITYAAGHLLFLQEPEHYDPNLKAWSMETLPIIPPNKEFKKRVYQRHKDRYKEINYLINHARSIVHVGDPDREGQCLIDELFDQDPTLPMKNKEVFRLLLPALDTASIQKALFSVERNEKFKGLYESAKARSYIDWLVGVNLTRLFTLAARKGGYNTVMRIGRVKTPTLALVANRYEEHKNHQKKTEYELRPHISKDINHLQFAFDPPLRFSTEKEAQEAITEMKLNKETITITSTDQIIHATPIKELYDLSSLQAKANAKYGISPKRTAEILQSLYEKKLTTYPRSDCKYLPESQLEEAKTIITMLNESELLEATIPTSYSHTLLPYNDKKITAHHAIVPTGLPFKGIDSEELKIYELIAIKYASMFFKPYEVEKETFIGTISDGKTLKATSERIIEPGYTVLEDIEKENDDTPKNGTFFTSEGDIHQIEHIDIKEIISKPKPLFTEGTLIKAMSKISSSDDSLKGILKEVEGIGTPATRDGIIENLLKEGLIERSGKSKGLIPTYQGINLLKSIPEKITSADYTAHMELALARVEENPSLTNQIIQEVIQDIETIVHEYQEKVIVNDATGCPSCSQGYLHLKQFKDEEGTLHQYYRCNRKECNSVFPAIKGNLKLISCPACDKGYLVSRKNTKNNTIFYACNQYPTCKKSMTETDFLELAKKKQKKKGSDA